MPEGAITPADAEFVETWENISSAQNWILRLDARGDERPELIFGRRNFLITTKERKIMQDKVVVETLDPFRNGAFRPVVVPDSVNVQTNPNALSDDEIRSIFVSSDLAWGEWMETIDSSTTFQRMMTLADESEISHKRYRELEKRYREVKPTTQIVQKDRDSYEAMTGESAPKRGGRKPAVAKPS